MRPPFVSFNAYQTPGKRSGEKRANAVMELQEEISLSINEKKIGKHFNVLIDRMESGSVIGRTEYDSPEVDNEVLLPADQQYLRIGDFVQARIVEATAFDLHAELAE